MYCVRYMFEDGWRTYLYLVLGLMIEYLVGLSPTVKKAPNPSICQKWRSHLEWSTVVSHKQSRV